MGQILSAGGGYGGGRRPVGPGQNSYGGGSNPYAPYGAGFGTDPNGPGGQWPGYYIGGGGPSGPPSGGSGNNTYNPSDPMGLGGAGQGGGNAYTGDYDKGGNWMAGGKGGVPKLDGGGGRRPVGPGQNSGGSPNWIGAPKPGGGGSGSFVDAMGGEEATPEPLGGMTMSNDPKSGLPHNSPEEPYGLPGGNIQNPMRRRRGGYTPSPDTQSY